MIIQNDSGGARGLVEMRSGLVVPGYIAEERARKERRKTGVDVFAGCGGFSLGFIQAGFRVVAAIEWQVEAVETYMCNLCRWGEVQVHFIEPADKERMNRALAKSFNRKNLDPDMAGSGWISQHPEASGVANIIVGDVRKLTGHRLLEIIGLNKGELGCMFGGPPCQGFSTAGKRNVADPRNTLVFEFARLIVETMPQTCVMENVPAITSMVTPDGVPVVERFCAILRDGGFQGVEAFEKAIKRPGTLGAMRKTVKSEDRKAEADPKPEEAELELNFAGGTNE